MRFYTQQHPYYCGVDLHTKMMYLCVISRDGEIVLHRNLNTDAKAFLAAVAPYRDGLVVGVECIFCWYWLADLCAQEDIAFVLGHVRNPAVRARQPMSLELAGDCVQQMP